MRNRSWLIIGLIVSLGLNLALGGFVVGQMTRPGPSPAMLDPSLALFRVVRELPDPRREALRPVMREHFHTLRGDIRRIRRAQREINEALSREPFDPAALDRALGEFRAALLDGQEDNHEALVRLAGRLTADERRQLQRMMTRPSPPRDHPRRTDGPPELR